MTTQSGTLTPVKTITGNGREEKTECKQQCERKQKILYEYEMKIHQGGTNKIQIQNGNTIKKICIYDS